MINRPIVRGTFYRDTTFSYAVSTTVWPSDVQKETTLTNFKDKIPSLLNDPNDQDKYKRNLLKAEIYFEEFNYEVIQEKPSFLVRLIGMPLDILLNIPQA